MNMKNMNKKFYSYIIKKPQARIVVDTIVCAFSQYCKAKYTAEIVEVVYPDNQTFYYPDLNYRMEEINYNKAISYIGIKYVIESYF